MTTIDQPRALHEAGASSVRGKSVGDREKTAQRLLRSAADRAYDGEVDIDWDAPVVPGLYWMTPRRTSLYGTTLWDKMTQEQRVELTRQELGSTLSFGIYVETILSAILWRQIIEQNGGATDHGRYALTEISEEARHSTMFGRLVNKLGIEPYTYPTFVMRLIRLIGLSPIGPSGIGNLLLVEEVLDRTQRESMMDETVQPHARQLMKIHVVEEARHITYAREELVRQIAERGALSNAMHRAMFALSVIGIYPLLFRPKVYRAVGIHPLRGFLAFLTSPYYRENATWVAEPLMRFMYEIGFLEGKFTGRLLRMSRAMPEDILAEIKSR